MATVGPTICGTGANDASNGSGTAWTNPGNITADDASVASCGPVNPSSSFYFCGTTGAEFGTIKLVKGGAVVGTSQVTYACMSATLTWYSHGGATNKWGTTWTDSDINASNFGVVATFVDSKFGDTMTNYLKATNFGFSIPGGATIDGIVVEIKANADTSVNGNVYVDAIRITVYYTAGAGPTSQTAILMGGAF